MRNVLLSMVLLLLLCIPAIAHEARPAFLEFRQTGENTYDVLWKVPARGPEQRLALYVRLTEDCRIVMPPETSYVSGAFIERFSIQREGGLAGAEVEIEGLSKTLTDVLVRIEESDGTRQLIRLKPDAPSFTVSEPSGPLAVAKTYLVLGVHHILFGVDHLLFVACLMMVAGTGRRLLITITGFTLAHSVTLALSTLELVKLPVPPVEAVIALSIVFVASEIAKGSRNTLTYRYPIAVSSSFGLLHGFGFAAVLSDIGLPRAEVPTGLLFFNLGVEAGQLMFVAVALIAMVAAKSLFDRFDWQLRSLERPVAYVCGSVAAFWMIGRIDFLWQ